MTAFLKTVIVNNKKFEKFSGKTTEVENSLAFKENSEKC